MRKKYRGAETDDFSKLQFSSFNLDYYTLLLKLFVPKYLSKKYLFENHYLDVKSIGFSGIVFGKWVSETEKLFTINAFFDLLKNNKSFYALIQKSIFSINKKIFLSFGSAGVGKARAYFRFNHNEIVLQFNHLERADKLKIPSSERLTLSAVRERSFASGYGSIYHEFGHFIDYALFKFSKFDNYKEAPKYHNANNYVEYIKKYSPEGKIGGVELWKYYSSNEECLARCFEMYMNAKYPSSFGYFFENKTMFEVIYQSLIDFGIYDYFVKEVFKKFE